jgi:hypothetical protein
MGQKHPPFVLAPPMTAEKGLAGRDEGRRIRPSRGTAAAAGRSRGRYDTLNCWAESARFPATPYRLMAAPKKTSSGKPAQGASGGVRADKDSEDCARWPVGMMAKNTLQLDVAHRCREGCTFERERAQSIAAQCFHRIDLDSGTCVGRLRWRPPFCFKN